MIPKLTINKNNKREHFNELLEVAYNKLNITNSNNNSKGNENYELKNNFYHEIFYFYKKNNSNNLATKIYTLFPNLNFEFRQIKNLSFSNTNLNKYLISTKFKLPEMENNNKESISEYNTGFFTMSQNHRLIALKDDLKEFGDVNKSQSLKEIIIGIWINLKEEKPTPKKADLDLLFNKYKTLIYKECFKFVTLSSNIETIYSPSPEENTFLLVIFYKGMQCHYEVKISNNKENKNFSNNNILINNINNWLICKCKYELDEQRMKIPFDFDIKIEINNGNISTMADYLNKKTRNNNNFKEKNKDKDVIPDISNEHNSNSNKNLINNINKELKKSVNSNNNLLNNNESDIYDVSDYEGDSINGEYNYPLAVPNMNKNNSNNNIIKNNQNKNENLLYKKQQHEISRASTVAHSYKPSFSSSKNSGKNNISNLENNVNENSFELINHYTSTIMKNSESIKRLQNQVNKLEQNILEIINQLEKTDKNKNNNDDNKNKKSKNKKENKSDFNNNQNISNIGDISINVPKIIYKKLSISKDDI